MCIRDSSEGAQRSEPGWIGGRAPTELRRAALVVTSPTAGTQVFDGPDRGLRWSERPLPSSLMPGEVLVQMRLATICGSDLHTLKGLRTEPVPAILGHEGVGVVTAMGEPRKKTSEEPNEDRPLEIGDRVTWSIADSCGHCVFCTTYGLPEKLSLIHI